jgi:hypothetical protein
MSSPMGMISAVLLPTCTPGPLIRFTDHVFALPTRSVRIIGRLWATACRAWSRAPLCSPT